MESRGDCLKIRYERTFLYSVVIKPMEEKLTREKERDNWGSRDLEKARGDGISSPRGGSNPW